MSQTCRKTLTSALALFMGLWLSGGHWVLLQVTAWSGMMMTRTLEMSVGEAFKTTFDGEHPCALCHAVKKGQKQETSPQSKPGDSSSKLKLEVTLSNAILTVFPPPPLLVSPRPENSLSLGAGPPEPPVPPPRALA